MPPDAVDTAVAEIELWFGADDLVDYGRAIDTWIVVEEPPGA